ncbi:hypothetical protein BDR06DRAFT_970020 [Suillus hirtellus]|nr:hypothetical protein BDR06DRAFT_970020 [Suillus hirtellus]
MLSTHDLPCICYNAPDDVIWCNALWVHYWDKDTWVLPIHHPSVIGHWVLCVIWLSHKELHLFDSLNDRKPWQSDVKCVNMVIMLILTLKATHLGLLVKMCQRAPSMVTGVLEKLMSTPFMIMGVLEKLMSAPFMIIGALEKLMSTPFMIIGALEKLMSAPFMGWRQDN